jgi:osmotically-inducible protein OsmY
MRRIVMAAALAALVLNLSGCVLAVGDDAGSGASSSWNSRDDDSSLARAVRQRLDADPLTQSAELSVTTERGRVYLDGVTSKPEVLAKAVEIALETPDVKSVRCHVTVIK